MRRVGLLSLLLCACPSAAPPPVSGPPANVSGKVELVLAPLVGEVKRFTRAGVKVVLEGLYTNVTQTDDAGDYRFEGVPPGRYTLRASFGEFTREGEVSAPIDAAPETEVTAPPLALTPAGTIVGRARLGGRDSGNLGIRVSVDGTDVVTTTNDSGGFTLSRVPEGSYRVRVEKSDYGGRTRRGIDVVFAETTTMDTLDIAPGIFSDFNNPPEFSASEIAMTPARVRPGTFLQPLPLDLGAGEVARYDTVGLRAVADDKDGDRLTYFWSVTAGSLDRTDVPEVLWTIDDDAALGATVTVRVVDERSGSAYLSRQLDVVDAQTLSGRLVGERVIYAYRPFSGTWRVLDHNLVTGALARVAEIVSLDDPRPMAIGPYYAATPFADGDRLFVTWTPGNAPVERDFAGAGAIAPLGARAVRMFDNAGKMQVRVFDPANNVASVLFSCGTGTCGTLATTRGDQVVTVDRGSAPNDDVTVHTYNSGAALWQSFTRGNVGERIRTDGTRPAFSNMPPGFERGARNAILRANLPGGSTSELYTGLYDVFLGAFDGRFVGFTEQEFRVVYSPEKAFVYDTQKNTKTELDPSDDYAYDEVAELGSGRVLIRRYPRADWLRDEQRTHYELCVRGVPP